MVIIYYPSPQTQVTGLVHPDDIQAWRGEGQVFTIDPAKVMVLQHRSDDLNVKVENQVMLKKPKRQCNGLKEFNKLSFCEIKKNKTTTRKPHHILDIRWAI